MSKEYNLSEINELEFLILTKQYDKTLDRLYPFIAFYTSTISYRKFKSNNKFISMLLAKHNEGLKCFVLSYYSHIGIEEIRADITYLVFLLIKRYKYQGKNFLAYLNNSFCYELIRFLYNENKLFLNHNGVYAFYDNGDSNLYDEKDSIENYIDIIDGYVLSDNMTLTSKWINENFHEEDSLFYGLTPIDKKILLYKFEDKISDAEIANKFNKHINTINPLKRRAIKILEDRFKLKYSRTRCVQKGDV